MEQIQNDILGIINSFKDLVNNDKFQGSIKDIFDSYSEEYEQGELSEEDKTQLKKDLDILKWMFQRKKNSKINYGYWEKRIDELSGLYSVGDKLYTLSIYDFVSNIVKKIYEINKGNDVIKEFYDNTVKLEEELYKRNFQLQQVSQQEVHRPTIRKDFLHKLDGMDVLRCELGDEKFIKLAVEGSFFFSKDLVEDSICKLNNDFKDSDSISDSIKVNKEYLKKYKIPDCIKEFIENEMTMISDEDKNVLEKVNKFINCLTKKNLEHFLDEQLTNKDEKVKNLNEYKAILVKELHYLKARHTINNEIVQESGKLSKGNKGIYLIDGKTFRVDIDIDGNRSVREMIKQWTGVTVSGGKDSLLQNTIISHVWGQACDPRYFTSLWNIVLIPAWANSLMDKEDAPAGTLASKMRATYMQICTQLYKDDLFPKSKYLQDFPEVKNLQDTIPGEYLFNIIKGKTNRNQTDPILIDTGIQEIKVIQNNQQQ